MESSLPAQETHDPAMDLTLQTDEELVILARESRHRPARDELLARSSRLRGNLIRRLSLATRLTDADRLDVMQESFLWTLEAIQNYHDDGDAAPGSCSFRSFLHRVISCRFIDFLRHRQRYYQHLVPVEVTRLADSGGCTIPQRLSGTHAAVHPEQSRPEQEAEADDLHDQLQQQLDRLDPQAQRLWSLLVIGQSIADIAKELHISYDTAKRQRRKLLLRHRNSLRA